MAYPSREGGGLSLGYTRWACREASRQADG
jgi:hypothetical protein